MKPIDEADLASAPWHLAPRPLPHVDDLHAYMVTPERPIVSAYWPAAFFLALLAWGLLALGVSWLR